jgi:hypothetical protein
MKLTLNRLNMDSPKLLILDINGLLCHKVAKDFIVPNGLKMITLKNYNVILRPFTLIFLEFCYSNYLVGFFSSTTYSNAEAILNAILTPEQKEKTVFKWYRDMTKLDPDYGINENIKKYDTIKCLSTAFEHPIINKDRMFTLKNTLICDDSGIKLRFNPKDNNIIFETFNPSNISDSVLKNMPTIIESKFNKSLNI